MLQQRFASGVEATVHLVFGVRYEASLMYREEFEQMASEHMALRATQMDESRQWGGPPARGRPLAGPPRTFKGAGHHGEFLFWPVLSRPPADWQGRVGHVQEHVMEALGDRRDVDVYICGLKAMVDDLRGRLKAAGLDRKRLIYEKYD